MESHYSDKEAPAKLVWIGNRYFKADADTDIGIDNRAVLSMIAARAENSAKKALENSPTSNVARVLRIIQRTLKDI